MTDPVLLSAYPVLRYFSYDHLRPELAAISRSFAELAELMADTLAFAPEVEAGLRKLLEAKDCFVRAALPKQ